MIETDFTRLNNNLRMIVLKKRKLKREKETERAKERSKNRKRICVCLCVYQIWQYEDRKGFRGIEK